MGQEEVIKKLGGREKGLTDGKIKILPSVFERRVEEVPAFLIL